MSYTTSNFRAGPEFTPAPIKKLILYTCLITIACPILNNIFLLLFGVSGPMDWLSLSWWGMHHYLFFQPATYLFTQYTGRNGIDFFFLLTLFFNMYVLWVFGSHICQRVGSSPFLRFYFITGILAGLTAFFFMPITHQYAIISGATPSILAILIAWSMFNPEAELLLFFLIPVKAKWLALGIVGAILLATLSNFNFVPFTLYFFAALYGYLYSLMIWGQNSPFPQLYKFELAAMRFASGFKAKLSSITPKRTEKTGKKKDTVIDIRTGNPQEEVTTDEDDRFVDSMLEKISKYGEHSLTWKEREKMQAISEKRRKNKDRKG